MSTRPPAERARRQGGPSDTADARPGMWPRPCLGRSPGAGLGQRADHWAPRLLCPRPLRHFVCPVAVAAAVLLVFEHLPAQDTALPVGRGTARGAARHLAPLAQRREVAGDPGGLLDHREQPQASLGRSVGSIAGRSSPESAWSCLVIRGSASPNCSATTRVQAASRGLPRVPSRRHAGPGVAAGSAASVRALGWTRQTTEAESLSREQRAS